VARQRIAVLIPHWRNPEGLKRSLASISPSDPADVVVVDDGSPDPPDPELVQSWFAGDGRLELVLRPQNAGIEAALNAGLDHIRAQGYDLVARLDCGDRHLGDRLRRQAEFLDRHPEVVLVGGAARYVDLDGHELFVMRPPSEHAAIRSAMFLNNAFIHPSVMFRVETLAEVGSYPTDFPAAEDYAFFWRFLDVGRVANLTDVLIEYEVDPTGISLSRRREQLASRLAVQRKHADGSLRAWYGRARTRALAAAPWGLVDRLRRITRRGASG
jgi:glycosyltransferase involved in cell wall biosynthesis